MKRRVALGQIQSLFAQTINCGGKIIELSVLTLNMYLTYCAIKEHHILDLHLHLAGQ